MRPSVTTRAAFVTGARPVPSIRVKFRSTTVSAGAETAKSNAAAKRILAIILEQNLHAELDHSRPGELTGYRTERGAGWSRVRIRELRVIHRINRFGPEL